MAKLIGLTGQTGAGKSIAARILTEIGFSHLDADAVAREVEAPGSAGLAAIARAFGTEMLTDDGALHRKKLAALVFNDDAALQKLNETLAPYLTAEISRQIELRTACGERYILLDAPTLFESGWAEKCDTILAVTAPESTRMDRIMRRDHLTEAQARQRVTAQFPETFFRENADIVIENGGDIASFRLKILECGGNIMDAKDLKKALSMDDKHAALRIDDAEKEKSDAFCADYIQFLNASRTERLATKNAVALLEEKGFKPFTPGQTLNAGDRIYVNNRGKAVIAAVIGTAPITEGVHICAAHIDSPRLDLKQNPLYEDHEMALLKTHYYGGIKKYQWTAIPLALCGVIVKKDGTTVDVSIGLKDDEPCFCVTDLLPHLANEQMKRTANDVVRGEELNLLVGSMPFSKDEESEQVKLNILHILNEKYGIIEDDFLSAELEAVPTFPAKEMGFDRSLIAGYGNDDRVCAYPALRAVLDCDTPTHTAVTILTDKEETGSDGNTGLCSSYLKYFLEDLADCFGEKGRHVMHASSCLSADVNAGFDPTFPDVMEGKNCAYLNHGVCVTKFTGARGKSGTSDAAAEFVGTVRRVLDEQNVVWQTGELGKVDAGGGGTVAAFIANLDIDTIDVGVPVLSMHAPLEVVAKLDVYMTYRAFCAFIAS